MSVASIPNLVSAEISSTRDNENYQTFHQKLKYISTHITVEPLVLLAILPSVMNILTTQNLNLEKACRVNLQYNTSVCDAMVIRDKTGYEPFQEREVQKLVSKMVTIKMIITGSYPAFLMLFLGSWSDRYGRRKPLILMPIVGDLVGTVCLFICSYFFLELPIEYSMLAETIPYALGGTWACGFLGLYTYVSGLCTDKDRTLRIGAITMCQNISWTLGLFASGIAVNILGFKGVYTVSSILMIISITYGALIIKEKWICQPEKNGGKTNSLKEFFSVKHVKNTFKICFRDGEDNRRTKMFAIMFLSTLIMGPYYGEVGIAYLYTRIKYGWNEIDYSLYNSLHVVIQIPGSAFALAFFSKYLGLQDAMLGVIAMGSKIISCFIYAFAPTSTFFYVGAFVEVFHGTCHIALRSLMAKIVPPHELGQSNSVFGIFEAVTPLVFGPIYTILYNATLTTFPGAFYLVSAGVYMITFYLFIWICREQKKSDKDMKQPEIIDKLLTKEDTEPKVVNVYREGFVHSKQHSQKLLENSVNILYSIPIGLMIPSRVMALIFEVDRNQNSKFCGIRGLNFTLDEYIHTDYSEQQQRMKLVFPNYCEYFWIYGKLPQNFYFSIFIVQFSFAFPF